MISNTLTKTLVIGGTCLMVLVAVAEMFPGRFWAGHFFTFLSTQDKVTVLLLSLTALFVPISSFNKIVNEKSDRHTYILAVIGALVFGTFSHSFNMVYDPYGDSVHFEGRLNMVGLATESAWKYLVDVSLDPWAGEKTVLAIVTFISNNWAINQGMAFKVLGLVCGVGFMFVWIVLVRRLTIGITLQLVLITSVFLSTPMLNFMGHAEIYAPSLFLSLLWCLIAIEFVRKPSKRLMGLLLVAMLVGIKLHPIAVLLVPSLFIASFRLWSKKWQSTMVWKNIALYLFLPVFFIGIVVYFFVLKDHVDDRSLETVAMQFDHLFLPLFSPDPPLHRYNILSLNHIIDFLNVIFIWSPGILAISFYVLARTRFFQAFNSTEFMLISVPLILYSALLFVINPLLSMPMDWDLFTLPLPFFITTCLLLIGKFQKTELKSILYVALVITLFTGFSSILMHQSKQSISERLEVLAVYVHRTYYEWTMNIIERSYSLVELEESEFLSRRESTVSKIRKHAVVRVDREFSELLRRHAKFHYRKLNDYEKATVLLNEAFEYYPKELNNELTMVELLFLKHDYGGAFKHSLTLVEHDYPTEEKALRIAIHCAIEAGKYDEALIYSEVYLSKWSDPLITEVRSRIASSIDVDSLGELFAQGF